MCLGRRSLRLLRKAITLPPSCGPPTPPDPTDIRPGRPLGRPYPAFCFCFVFWLSLLLGPALPPAHAEPHASLSPGGSALGIPGRLLPRGVLLLTDAGRSRFLGSAALLPPTRPASTLSFFV